MSELRITGDNVVVEWVEVIPITPPVEPPVEPPIEPPTLTPSGPQVSTHDGQVFENLFILADGETGLEITHDNVTVKNIEIGHQNGYGIHAVNAHNLRMDGVAVARIDPPEGVLPHTETNILIEDSNGVGMRHIRTQHGSSGIVLLGCADLDIAFHHSLNTRGLFDQDGDRIGMGNGLKLRRCARFKYADFSHFNDREVDSTADNVSVMDCIGGSISRGLIDGNNDPSGTGVQIEQCPTGVYNVTDVDAIHMGNGAFSAYSDTSNVTWANCRTRDNSLKDWGRGYPKSAGRVGDLPKHSPLCWASGPTAVTGNEIVDGVYFNVTPTDGPIQPDRPNLTWNIPWFDLIELREEDFTPRTPYIFTPPW